MPRLPVSGRDDEGAGQGLGLGQGSNLDSEVRTVALEGSKNPNQGLRSANVQFLHTASKEGLRVISLGMEKAIRQADRRSGEDLESCVLD